MYVCMYVRDLLSPRSREELLPKNGWMDGKGVLHLGNKWTRAGGCELVSMGDGEKMADLMGREKRGGK